MKIIPLNNKLLFRYLKEIDAHYRDEYIGLETYNEERLDSVDIKRIDDNGWNNNNKYIYVLSDLNVVTVQNFLTVLPICHGFAINLNEYNSDFNALIDYAISENKKIFLKNSMDIPVKYKDSVETFEVIYGI